MKKRKSINIHILISISSIVLFSLALLACLEMPLNETQYTFSDIFSKILYNAAKNKKVPDNAIVDEGTSEAARTIFNALGVKAGDAMNFRYVKSTGNDDNDGTTWIKAKQSIEATLDAISNAPDNNPYLVLIGSGTYTPTKTLSMKNHVAIIGGFDASSNEASSYERNRKTIINGESKRQVFNNTNLNKSAVLARVTICNGKATNGGGMYNENSSPTIMHTTFSGNTATNNDGGIANVNNSSPTIMHTTFSGNTSEKEKENGGGMYNENSSPTITYTTFSGNTATNNGGGIANVNNSSPTIMHTTFSGNTATNNGGGIANVNNSSPTIMHTTFSGNTSEKENGGGMYNWKNSSPIITHTTFSGNTAEDSSGGGMLNWSSSPTITHTTFSGNTAKNNGGGMTNWEKSSPIITHTTFSGNTATTNGGGMYNSNRSSPTISSSIFWGNTKKNGEPSQQITNHSLSSPVIAYSIVQGGYTDTGGTSIITNIITKDPKLQPLANNGGFIETIAIKAESSAAINKGLYGAHKGKTQYYSKDLTNWYKDPTLQTSVPSLPKDAIKYTTDARGYGYKSHPDIGAFEYEGTVPLPTP